MALKTILVATDFSAMAEHALDYALALAAPLGASVTVVHVYEAPSFSLPPGYLVPTSDVVGVVEGTAKSDMAALLEKKKKPGIAMTGVVRQGLIGDEIEAVATEIRADLVVVGTHGRRGLSRALLGSVAETVLKASKHPVLTVPPA